MASIGEWRCFRKKLPTEEWIRNVELKRCLNLFDLIMMGIGTTVGAGIFVAVGVLIRYVAGPAIVFSFLIAAVPVSIIGLCYAEFASRIPKAGGNFIYAYVSLGEIWAFFVGWSYGLDTIVTVSLAARASSEYIDALVGGEIHRFLEGNLSWGHVEGLGPFPDLMAVLVIVIIAIVVALGAKHSSVFMNVVTSTKLAVVLLMIVVGTYVANTDNWSTTEKFFPYGVSGVLLAAAQCYYALNGVDTVAMAAEEASDINNVIRAIIVSIGATVAVYIAVSVVVTLMVPYNSLAEVSPLAELYGQKAFLAAKYIVSAGGLCALLTTLMANIFVLARLMYAMSSDGMLPGCFAKVHQGSKVPIYSTVTCAIITGVLAVLLDVRQLLELVSMGQLTGHIFLAIGVLLTRFQPNVQSVPAKNRHISSAKTPPTNWLSKACSCFHLNETDGRHSNIYERLGEQAIDHSETDEIQKNTVHQPNNRSYLIASLSVSCLVVFLIVLCALLEQGWSYVKVWHPLAITAVVLLGLPVILSVVLLHTLPKNLATFPYMVPCVPLVPLICVKVDVVLVMRLSRWSYIRFVIWNAVGE